ncbi:hypothetical protein [Oryzicola mucosus]|nr:hypothetical protein [Oryzicola mucosus]
MPTETIVTITGVLAVFAFFAAVVCFVDLTWQPKAKRKTKD